MVRAGAEYFLVVTLNLTVLTERTIYQSADFRLTEADSGAFIRDDSDKIVVVTGAPWNGFITYTGIGAVGNVSVAATVSAWLTGFRDKGMAEAAELIRTRATRWYSQLLRGRSLLRHSFVLAGFARTGARAFVISNFERWEGSAGPIKWQFVTTAVSTRRGAKVLVTGSKSAISRRERR